MKLNIENFETMTPGYSVSNILSDISTNRLSNSKVDEINANIKGELDNLLKQIQDKHENMQSHIYNWYQEGSGLYGLC